MNTSVPNEAPSGCPVCGADLPPNAPRGLCPKCLLDGAAAPTEPATSPQGRPEPPPIEAVRAAFPQLEVLELIGAGGMGAVYRARQPKLDRLVALKLLAQPSGQNPAFIERFHREARVLARLNHPNIVAVFDFGEASGFSYLLMEYVDGVNLRQAMHTRRFTPEQALAIVPRLCEALQFAHEQGILHRDIKPENILLDSLGRVKIADFGIAKLVGGDKADVTLTASGAALGTPAYMAPEQLRRAGKVDHRADIYSLGVLFYEMLTGDLPVGRFDPPSQRVQVDVRLDHVVLRALENQPDRRYQHASEIKSEVEGITRAPSLPGPAAGGSSATATAPAAGWASTPAQDSRGDLDAVKEAVRGPAIGLMVAGGLDVASSLLPMLAAWLGTLGGAFRGSAGLPAFGIWELGIVSGMGSVSMVAAVFTVLGGQAMMRLKSSGLATAGCILGLIPTGPAWLLGLPMGIWGLVMLGRPPVKAVFAGVADGTLDPGFPTASTSVGSPPRLSIKALVSAGLAALFVLLALSQSVRSGFSPMALEMNPRFAVQRLLWPGWLGGGWDGVSGMASSAWPIIWLIGLAAAMTGFLALRDIRTAGGRLIGLPVALAGALPMPLLVLDTAILGAASLFSRIVLPPAAGFNSPGAVLWWIILPLAGVVALMLDLYILRAAWRWGRRE